MDDTRQDPVLRGAEPDAVQDQPEPGPEIRPSADTPRGYRFCRWLLRLWFGLSFPKMRALGAEKLPAAGPVLLAVSHPASFLDALILVAAFDRPVACLLREEFLQGFWAGLWARGLGMIPYEPGEETGRPALEACVDTLAREGVVVVFAEPASPGSSPVGQNGFALTAASIAVAAEVDQASSLSTQEEPPANSLTAMAHGESPFALVLIPVDLYLPLTRSRASELLIYLDSPLRPREHLMAGGPEPQPASGSAPGQPENDPQSWARALAALLESCWRESPFRLRDEDLKWFASDLEEVLRADLEEDWASRPNWKQKIDAFQLSGFAAAWVEQANYLHPGRLVALREALEAYREARRRGARRQAEVEAAQDWLHSPLRRVGVLVETALGWPIALYGLLNHLLALLILSRAGLLERRNEGDQPSRWLSRGLVLLGCYGVQILLVAYLLGRSGAGDYAPTLPVTGLYLWRYFWLLRHRTRPAFLALFLRTQTGRLRRRRRKFVAEVDRTLQGHAELLGAA